MYCKMSHRLAKLFRTIVFIDISLHLILITTRHFALDTAILQG